MDPITNPFSPGAGSPPPELAGRDGLLERARILFGRVKAGRPEKSILLTGLRGVGKTVLLNEIDRIAKVAGFSTILFEVHEGKSFAALLASHLRRLLYELDRLAGAGNKVRQGLSVLRSFISAIKVSVGEIEVGLDIEPQRGAADTGDLEIDLPDKDLAWSSGFVSAVEVDEEARRWTAVLRVPLAAFDTPRPEEGTRWRMNLYRCDRANDAYLAWRPVLRGNFHTPERFGVLEFGGPGA